MMKEEWASSSKSKRRVKEEPSIDDDVTRDTQANLTPPANQQPTNQVTALTPGLSFAGLSKQPFRRLPLLALKLSIKQANQQTAAVFK
jgi:hypothetical protein